MDPHMK